MTIIFGWLVTTAYLVAVISCLVASQKARMRHAALRTPVQGMETDLPVVAGSRLGDDGALQTPTRSPEFSWIWRRVALLISPSWRQLIDWTCTRLIQSGGRWPKGKAGLPTDGWFKGLFSDYLRADFYCSYRWQPGGCRAFLIRHRLVTLGLAILIGFIFMRAADFNHVWLRSLQAVYEDSWKNYLELLGLGLIAEGARRASKP